MNTDLFTNLPPSNPPALEAARRRLAELQARAEQATDMAEIFEVAELIKPVAREVRRLEEMEAEK